MDLGEYMKKFLMSLFFAGTILIAQNAQAFLVLCSNGNGGYFQVSCVCSPSYPDCGSVGGYCSGTVACGRNGGTAALNVNFTPDKSLKIIYNTQPR